MDLLYNLKISRGEDSAGGSVGVRNDLGFTTACRELYNVKKTKNYGDQKQENVPGTCLTKT